MSETIRQHNLDDEPMSVIERQVQLDDVLVNDRGEAQKRNTFRKWAGRIALGVAVAGGGVAFATSPIEELKDDVMHSAPWAVPAVIGSETLFVGGAALVVGSAGMAIGNPLTLKKRARSVIKETGERMADSKTFRTGLRVNTVGALGTAGVVMTGAAVALPPETWPGAVGLAALDMAGTVGLRLPAYRAINKAKAAHEKDSLKVTVRQAELEDIDRLADIDLELFDQAYGEALPNKQDVVDMLTARWENAKGWMYVAEQNGQVEGFVTAFRTNKSAEDFESWEESTANGTLNGKVDPEGKYVYVANMTIKHDAVVHGAKDMLLANLFANAIHEGGVEYGYWESRMPQFKEWLDETGRVVESAEELDQIAHEYAELTREDGKRYDWQLRMYESDGFKLKNLVANAFNDEASMNYGAVFTVPCPPNSDTMKRIAPVRKAYAAALRLIAKNPKLLAKVV